MVLNLGCCLGPCPLGSTCWSLVHSGLARLRLAQLGTARFGSGQPGSAWLQLPDVHSFCTCFTESRHSDQGLTYTHILWYIYIERERGRYTFSHLIYIYICIYAALQLSMADSLLHILVGLVEPFMSYAWMCVYAWGTSQCRLTRKILFGQPRHTLPQSTWENCRCLPIMGWSSHLMA